MRPIVAIVGRPNVGKSTLFNRLVGHRKAMVDDMPGVTRDRNYANVDRYEVPFILVDTGGFEPVTADRMLQQMREQSQLAMDEADVIFFVMDGREGLTPADREVAQMLRRVKKPVFYLVNKVDGEKLELNSADFYSLGIESMHTISAEHNRGINDLIEELMGILPSTVRDDSDEDITKIAVVGRPNVGKSSLVNKLVGFERSVANPTPGTTRDSIDTLFSLVEILDLDLEYLFSDFRKERSVQIVRAGERRTLSLPGYTYEQLVGAGIKDELHGIEAFQLTIQAGCEKGNREYGHPGRELGIITAGNGEFIIGNVSHLLAAGDSISFEADVPHILRNTGNDILRAYWVVTPPRGEIGTN